MIDLPPPALSVLDRPIALHRAGSAAAPRRVLVVGSMHGDEPGGRALTRALLRVRPPAGTAVYVVHDLNPDGARRGTRGNARGVDLNRNFPHRWRRARRGRFWPGPRAASEPETRAAMRFVRAVRPHVTIWIHQPYGIVVPADGADRRIVRRYARIARLPVRRLARLRGTAAGWTNRTLPGGGAFVVELAPGRPSRAVVRRHVRAVRAAARGETARAPAARAAGGARRGRARSAARSPRRPRIAWTPIPYGPARTSQMRRYARRHAGIDSAELRDPQVIVQHHTASSTFASAFATFASNAPDLGERPGTCAHFVVDRDGTIHQLVPLRLMCRHAVGLNHTAIGIEHVGTSDADVMGRRKQLRASLRLTRWLRAREDIALRDVIGHAESRTSPHHRELVPSWRRLTHGDMGPATMRRYRAMLAGRRARAELRRCAA